MARGAPHTVRKMVPASTTQQGPVKQAAARANAAAYAAPAAGAVATTSAAAGDFTALAAAFAALVTEHNDLLAKLRVAGVLQA